MTSHFPRAHPGAIDSRDRETAIVLAAQAVSGGDPPRTAMLEARARRDPKYLALLTSEARRIDQDHDRRTVDLSAPAEPERRPRSRVEEVVDQLRERTGDPTIQVTDRNPNRNAPPPPAEIPESRSTRRWVEQLEEEQEDALLAVELTPMEDRAAQAVVQLGFADPGY